MASARLSGRFHLNSPYVTAVNFNVTGNAVAATGDITIQRYGLLAFEAPAAGLVVQDGFAQIVSKPRDNFKMFGETVGRPAHVVIDVGLDRVSVVGFSILDDAGSVIYTTGVQVPLEYGVPVLTA